jgi:hypothetical protein
MRAPLPNPQQPLGHPRALPIPRRNEIAINQSPLNLAQPQSHPLPNLRTAHAEKRLNQSPRHPNSSGRSAGVGSPSLEGGGRGVG